MQDADTLFIPVLLGTARKNRRSEHAARFVCEELAKREGMKTEFIDVRNVVPEAATLPPWGQGGANEQPSEWKHTMERADGLVIVTPEYNHGYPGELKIALDALYDEYKHKPVGLCGVSTGGLGGARVVDQIKPVLAELSMIVMRNAGYFSNAKELFDGNGMITDPDYGERLTKLFDELTWYARALKRARAEV